MSRSRAALFVLLGGLAVAIVGALPTVFFHLVNYRDMTIPGWFELWLWTAIVFFSLGVYITALGVQRSLRQEANQSALVKRSKRESAT
ncbi:hypothetical protein [Trichocoleus sp. FACHB-262]|uniref:hypothetical protein n=1 Tax=Trichocoleus sp. FACHB-262 TaxID=2692869 RepID=UPI00168A39B5|nr:hypothetical protein [Trichocoleus sp. FACHB-262]MBD2124221.1 hypothetical protein [Trichocoleus sp. FACHB-262]